MPLWRARRRDEDFADEVESHLQLEADRLAADGMDPEAARWEARRRFGNPARAREEFYFAQRRVWLDHLRQDLVTAWRGIRRYPFACAVAIVSLAAGISATATTLVLRNAIFRSPPPLYTAPASLHFVRAPTPDNPRRLVPAGLYAAWAAQPSAAGRLAAAAPPRQLDVRADDQQTTAAVRPVTPHLFSVLGVDPMLGTRLESWPAGEIPPAVLSAGAWLRLFAGREGVIGETILVDSVPHTVVAVMPPRFWFGGMDAPIWTVADLATLSPDALLNVVVRRGPDVTEAELSHHLSAAAAEYAASLPGAQRQLAVSLLPVRGTPLGNNVGPMVVGLLTGAVLLTLAIACTNVAVLMMAQWTAREHEIAIRASLGSSRGRIVRALLTESTAIAAAAGGLGVAVTFALCGLARRKVPTADLYALSVDPLVVVQTAALSLAVGFLAGILPALYETRRLHANPLVVRGSDRVRQRWRHGLVVFEIAATVALLVSAGAMLASYARALSESPGFDTHPVLAARVDHREGVDPAPALDRLRALPGIAGAAVATIVPHVAPGAMQTVTADGSTQQIAAYTGAVGPHFVPTLGVTIVAGRTIDERDTAASLPVVVVNDVLAARLWGSSTAAAASAVGQRLRIPGAGPAASGEPTCANGCTYTVVGIVTGFAMSNEPVRPLALTAYAQLPSRPGRTQLLVRASGDAAVAAETVRRELGQVGGGLSVAAVVTVDQIIEIIGQEIVVGTMPLVPLIATGILLTAAGVYGVLAFAVTRRSTELAVRIAVGADRRDLVRLVAAHSGRLLLLGTAIGIGLTYAVTRFAQGSGGAFDSPGWGAFVVPAVVIVAVGAVATLVPIRRALAIQPALLLRRT